MNVLARVLAVDSKYPRAFTVVYNAIGAFLALVLFFVMGGYKHFILPNNYKAYVFLLAGLMAYGLFDRLRFLAAKLVEASVLPVFYPISMIITFLIASVLYNEPITLYKVIALVFITLSVFLISYNKNIRLVSKKGAIVAILVSIALGLGGAVDKMGATAFNSETYGILMWTFSIIFVYFFPRVPIKHMKFEIKRAKLRNITILVFTNVISYYFLLRSYALLDATLVILLIQSASILTVLAGIIFLKERKGIKLKLLATTLSIAGVILLVI